MILIQLLKLISKYVHKYIFLQKKLDDFYKENPPHCK